MHGTRCGAFRWARCPLVLEQSERVIEFGVVPVLGKLRRHISENVPNESRNGEEERVGQSFRKQFRVVAYGFDVPAQRNDEAFFAKECDSRMIFRKPSGIIAEILSKKSIRDEQFKSFQEIVGKNERS